MKTVEVTITFKVRTSNRTNGHCTCGAAPKHVECYSTYGSSPLMAAGKATFYYSDLGVDTDEIWDGDATVTDSALLPVLRCSRDHHFVNPHCDVR